MRPSAERPLAVGEKNPVNPVYPVKKNKIESNPNLFDPPKFHKRCQRLTLPLGDNGLVAIQTLDN